MRPVVVPAMLFAVVLTIIALGYHGSQSSQAPGYFPMQPFFMRSAREGTGKDASGHAGWPPPVTLPPDPSRSTVDPKDEHIRDFATELRRVLSASGAMLEALAYPVAGRPVPNSPEWRRDFAALARWIRPPCTRQPCKDETSDERLWPANRFFTPKQKARDRGIVICAGNPHVAHLHALFYSIRKVFASKIAIAVTFAGEDDLSRANREALADAYTGIEFIDLTDAFDLPSQHLGGWNLKAASMLVVPFKQVAVLDVDVILYQAPEALFSQKEFVQHGALFYHDRVKPWHAHADQNPLAFLRAMQSTASPLAVDVLTHGARIQMHIQEAGVVLIDKQRRMSGLLAACILIGDEETRSRAQSAWVYGDKEFYWIGFEVVQDAYGFARFYPGNIGSVFHDGKEVWEHLCDQGGEPPESALCGRMTHTDSDGNPLWSNGGYTVKEEDWDAPNTLGRQANNPQWLLRGPDSHQIKDQQLTGELYPEQPWYLNSDVSAYCLMPGATQSVQRVDASIINATSRINNVFLHEFAKLQEAVAEERWS